MRSVILERQIPAIAPYLSLDLWRGLASLWVVMGHSCISYIGSGHNDLLGDPIYFISVWCQLGVVAFFVISGYCIGGAALNAIRKGQSSIVFLRNRAKRIYPPYLIACAICITIYLVTIACQKWHILPAINHPAKLGDWKFFATNLTLTQAFFRERNLLLVAWSLCYEVVFYLIIAIPLQLGRIIFRECGSRQVAFLFSFCGILTIACLFFQICKVNLIFPFDRWYQFGAGIALVAIELPLRYHKKLRIVTFLVILLEIATFASIAASTEGNLAHPAPLFQAWTACLFAILLWALRKIDNKIAHCKPLKPAIWLGVMSYSIYLIHALIIGFVDAGLRKLGFEDDKYIVTYLAQIGVSVAAGWAFFRLFETRFITKGQTLRIADEKLYR